MRHLRQIRRIFDCAILFVIQFLPKRAILYMEQHATDSDDKEMKVVMKLALTKKDKFVRYWIFWPSKQGIVLISADKDGRFENFGKLW